MTEKAAMYAALRDHTGIKAVVGTRVYPDQAPIRATPDGDVIDSPMPYLVFQVTNSAKPRTLNTPATIRRTDFELTGFCETRQEAEDLAEALEDLLDGKKRQIFGDLLVKASIVQNAIDEDESPMPGAQFGDRTVLMFVVWWV